MHKHAKFRQIGDAKQLVCMIFLRKQSRRRQDMKTINTEVKKKQKQPHNDMHYFFDIRNSLKVKSSFAKVNFLLKTNTLDVSTTEQQRK